ncbi:MAG: hypothetical protein LBU46_02265 [Candidatus Accumulibacter sp.]|jgi:hypothetical protein|nr:hypothetical protein [Accumulibacter sp.]
MEPKNLMALVFVALLVGVPGYSAWWKRQQEQAQREEQQQAARAWREKAEAMFQERCKKAGVFIHRTADNVESVFLLKLRPNSVNFRDQYKMDDPYGSDFGGDAYIKSFLWARNEKGQLVGGNNGVTNGYRYVDAIDPKDGKRYRYTGSIKEVILTKHITMGGDGKTKFKSMEFVFDKVPAPDPAPRYGVTYEDISTREERDHWIAGSSLKVIDLKTNEVMAERIGYMMDRGWGSTSGGRSPWLFAADHACPMFSPHHGSAFQARQTRNFVEEVLYTVPKK